MMMTAEELEQVQGMAKEQTEIDKFTVRLAE